MVKASRVGGKLPKTVLQKKGDAENATILALTRLAMSHAYCTIPLSVLS